MRGDQDGKYGKPTIASDLGGFVLFLSEAAPQTTGSGVGWAKRPR